MIVIDIFIVVFVVGLLLVGGPVVVRKLLRMDPKRKELEAAQDLDEIGETNTVRHNLTELRKCFVCKKSTNPAKDLRTGSVWVHLDCYISNKDQVQ